jgi:methionine-rich copper-binding protein CopC
MNMKRVWMRICVLFALYCCVALAGNAWAHAHPKSMVPAADATVAAPAEVSMTFTEALEAAFSSIAVVDAAGHAVANGKAEVDSVAPTVMHLALPALAPGVYTVKWVAVARDGHRTSGSYSFTVK